MFPGFLLFTAGRFGPCRGEGLKKEYKEVLLDKFSKAQRLSGVVCTDNSWPFWNVTSLELHMMGKKKKSRQAKSSYGAILATF